MAEKDPFALAFSARLRAAMTVAGILTAADLARAMHNGESRVRNWCNGTATPTVQEAARLAKYLSVTMDWLFRDRADGLEEGRRIRLVAAMDGISAPYFDPEPEPARAAEIPGLARASTGRRAKVATD
jgi:transcriptional regulator with XRE-family HTH domain